MLSVLILWRTAGIILGGRKSPEYDTAYLLGGTKQAFVVYFVFRSLGLSRAAISSAEMRFNKNATAIKAMTSTW